MVVCPLHGFRFDLEEGTCDQPGTCPVATYPVEVIGGFVRVGVPVAI
jgi:nitrite reductase/ring-hydroxylating ferredoxin subunit